MSDSVELSDNEFTDDGVDVSPAGVGRRVRVTALVLSLLGLADSTYLTVAHFETNLLSVTCPANTVDNCQAVTTGPWSHPFGIPVAILGLAFYLAFTTINLPHFWVTKDVRVHWLRAAMAVSGIGFVLYLIYVELFLAKLICLYCTGVHIVTFALFILIATTLPTMVQAQNAGWDDEADWEDGADHDGEPEFLAP